MPRKLLQPGDVLGNVRVIEIEIPAAKNPRLRVEFLCCNTEGSLSQDGLESRVKNNTKLCRHCSRLSPERAALVSERIRAKMEFTDSLEFKPGREVAGLRIEKAIAQGDNIWQIVYAVTYLCCERTGVITHKAVVKRRRKHKTMCARCARAAAELHRNPAKKITMPQHRHLEDYGVTPPPWPAPSGTVGTRWYGR